MSNPRAKAADSCSRVLALCDVLAAIAADGFDVFATDVKTQWAAELGLIRLGETVNRIPAEIRAEFPGQPWRQIVAMRRLAAHQYDDLDPRRVWRTLTQDVPALRAHVADTVLPALES